MLEGTLPGYWDGISAEFITNNGTQAKILADVTPARVMPAVSGETPRPGEPSVRQRVLTGGCRVLDLCAVSTDGTDRSVLIAEGVETTVYADMGTATTTATTNSTITRTSGSFITDGYKVGDCIMLFGAATDNNNGTYNIVTAVAAGSLTVSGTTGIPTAETQAAGFRILKMSRPIRFPVPANSGNTDTAPAKQLLGSSQWPRLDSTGISLGAKSVLVASMVAAISALPAQVSVRGQRALY